MQTPTLLLLLLLGAAQGSGAEEEAVPRLPGAAVLEAETCALCHSNAPAASAMRTADGRGVAPHDLWRATMMASAARDPLWRAFVSAEVAAAPELRAEIERTCLACHAPMAAAVGLDDHGTGSLLHVLDCDGRLGDLARDGVSCTVCHGISPEGLGEPETFSGAFELDPARRLFGPHAAPFAMPMRMHTGFTPTEGPHVLDSALCASCHTLETAVLDPEGREVGRTFLEQAPYLEWLASDYRDGGPREASCQACHVPTRDDDGAPIRTRIARNPGGRDFPPTRAREPFGRHVFVGGNTLGLSLLRDHGGELRAPATPEAYERTIAATRRQLQERTARVGIERVRAEAGRLAFDVRVENLTGHKLPTAHPTRRAWLRVVVRDARGEVVFRSGATDGEGRLVDGAGRPLPSEIAGGPTEPHRDTVRAEDEVATYEAVLGDVDGASTHRLLRADHFLVDHRLLPAGWSPASDAGRRTAPVGTASDADFGPGGDVVHFEVPAAAPGPLSVEAALLFQPLGPRWVAELARWDTEEVAAYLGLHGQADLEPEVLAEARWAR